VCSRGLVVAGALSFVKNAVLPYVLYELLLTGKGDPGLAKSLNTRLYPSDTSDTINYQNKNLNSNV